jgi:hypothetical protein
VSTSGSGTITIGKLIKAGHAVAKIGKKLTRKKSQERWLHGVLLGYLEGKYGRMSSEWRVEHGSWTGRIDLRRGGPNPDLIEFVVRWHGVEEGPRQNAPELRKLCRVPGRQARHRFLLIVDLTGDSPMSKGRLKQRYDSWNAGRGRFERHAVRVVYVHPQSSYHFLWKPHKH